MILFGGDSITGIFHFIAVDVINKKGKTKSLIVSWNKYLISKKTHNKALL